MTITAAHISPIVALIAGILILIMPRLLNFIVAIYLIFIGLVGLGVLKMVAIVALESRVSRLARNPSKWCKARNLLPFLGCCNAMAKAVAKPKKTAREIAAKSKPSAPGPRPRRRPRPARR